MQRTGSYVSTFSITLVRECARQMGDRLSMPEMWKSVPAQESGLVGEKPTFNARDVGKFFSRRSPPAQTAAVQECTVYRVLAGAPPSGDSSSQRN